MIVRTYGLADLFALVSRLLAPFTDAIRAEFATRSVNVHTAPAATTTTEIEMTTTAPAEVPAVVTLATEPAKVEEVPAAVETTPVAGLVGHVSYYPEMSEPKPEAEIEAQMSHTGKHWYLRTRLTLTVNRGVKFVGVLTAGQLVPGSRLVGWNEYKVTNRAFDLLSKQYRIVSESLL